MTIPGNRPDFQPADPAEENDLRQVEHDSERAGYPVPPLEGHDRRWRSHHASHFGGAGDFSEYEAAYRHGLEAARTQHGLTAEEAEPHLRETWEAKRPGTWETLRDAIHYGFQSLGAP